MLTSLQIGQNGRLGNQMFQYAALVGTAFVRGYDWKLQDNENVVLRKVFKMPNAKILTQKDVDKLEYRYFEQSFDFNPGLFLVEDFTDIHGHFQSASYFSDAFDYLKEDFEFVDNLKATAQYHINTHRKGKRICSLHVRRGDYLTKSDYHPPCTLEYYKKAKQIVNESTGGDVTFLCFGDDHDWIAKNLIDDQSKLVFGNTPEVDFCMMTMCDAHIIANSSFSWWAATLGNVSSVIAPLNWFGPAGPKKWQTVYINGWVIV